MLIHVFNGTHEQKTFFIRLKFPIKIEKKNTFLFLFFRHWFSLLCALVKWTSKNIFRSFSIKALNFRISWFQIVIKDSKSHSLQCYYYYYLDSTLHTINGQNWMNKATALSKGRQQQQQINICNLSLSLWIPCSLLL